jgi:hypothetical protein
VARLETLIESLLEDRDERKASDGLRGLDHDSVPLTPHSEDTAIFIKEKVRAPVLSLFDNAVWSRKGEEDSASSGSPTPSPVQGMRVHPTVLPSSNTSAPKELSSTPPAAQNPVGVKREKNQRVCKTLLAALPGQEKINEGLEKHAQWWAHIQKKLDSGKETSLAEYMENAVANDDPIALAKIVQMVATVMDESPFEKLLLLVDRLIIHDDEYMSSIEGLECALFQGRFYSDIGQARRSWYVEFNIRCMRAL